MAYKSISKIHPSTKLVDMVAVTATNKPLSGGKCEKFWRVNEKTKNEHRSLLKGSKDLGYFKNNKKDLKSKSEYDILTEYGFKGFEFGNWNSQADRYQRFEAFKYSVSNMAFIFGSKNIGFDFNIGIAFGARGSRGAAAHYEPDSNIINMTKWNGANSLMHEYAHALDYNIGAFFDQNPRFTALSGGHTLIQPTSNTGGQFRYLMNTILNYVRSTESFSVLSKIFKGRKLHYWGNSTELFARLMEAFVGYYYYDHIKDDYLVKEPKYYEELSLMAGIYLSRKEMKEIKPTVEKLIIEIGSLLNDRCTLKAYPYPQNSASFGMAAAKKPATKKRVTASKETTSKATGSTKAKK